jgi:hypothetical protein
MKKMAGLFIFALIIPFIRPVSAQTASNTPVNYPPPVTFTTAQDHQNMMEQLGIEALRPGRNPNAGSTNPPNYDKSLANPYPDLPNPLVLNNGKAVTTATIWWKERRPQLVKDFENDVYGKVPAHTPPVNWQVDYVDHEYVGRRPVTVTQLTGHVDNSAYPLIDVEMKMTMVLPSGAQGAVPLLIMFGRSRAPAPSQPNPEELDLLNTTLKKLLISRDSAVKKVFEAHPAYQMIRQAPGTGFAAFFAPPPPKKPGPEDVPGVLGVNNDPASDVQLVQAGWGFAYLDPGSIQPDNGAGLTRGIIGLCNKGQPRKPDDWGSLRAWAWGASQALDYLKAHVPAVDPRHVGIEGVSRYGKAALVTMAFDTSFAMGLIGSSGRGGASLFRRNWGEALENLTGEGEYQWMAGNFLKYGASKSKFGSMTAADLPVDSHELIALCAPRLVFISYGAPERGDAKWVDQQGAYMAAVAASPVFKLLGARGLGVQDYHTARMPPVNTPMLDGQLAWRQHDQGHQDQANMKWFIRWVDKNIGFKPPMQR